MKKTSITLIAILTSVLAYSQTIIVTDKTSLQPLINVAIFNNNLQKTVATNSKGQAEIADFKGIDSINFQYVGYHKLIYSYQQLDEMKFKISMTEKAYSLDEIVVSASRFKEKIKDIPQQIQVMKAKELAFMSQQTTADVMQNSGNILVQKSQSGGGSPIIRGFEANKVLLVVDGVRMNNAIFRGGHLQNILSLDNSILEKTEIVFGPGSVMYGSDALGGVMHFYTKSPLLSDTNNTSPDPSSKRRGNLRVNANAFSRYSSANNEKTEHIDVNLGGKKFASLTSFSWSDFGDLKQGKNGNPSDGKWDRVFYVDRVQNIPKDKQYDVMKVNDNKHLQRNSGYKQYDILQKFLFKQSDKVSHNVNLQYSNSSNVPRYDRLTTLDSKGKPVNAEWYYGPQMRFFSSYSLNLKAKKGIYDDAKIVLSLQDIEESRHDRKFNSVKKNHRTERVYITTLNADFAKKIKRNEIRYGYEMTYNQVVSTARQENIVTEKSVPLDTRYPDGGSTMETNAAYLTHSFEISPKWIVNEGLRMSAVELKSKFNDTTFFPFPFKSVAQKNAAITPTIGLVYMPGYDWRFTLVGSSGFRAPNVDDLSKVFESTMGNIIVPNPDLKPEETYNLDLGFSKIINKKITIGATAFYTIFDNVITTKNGNFNGKDSIFYDGKRSAVVMSDNAASAYIYGANAYFNIDVTNNFSINNTINYTYGRIKTDTSDYPLDHIAPVFGKTSFNWNLKKFRAEFFVLYNDAKRSKDYNLMGEDNHIYSADIINGYMPAWATLNIRTAYQFNKTIQLQFAVENILDKNYRVFASNISAAGRNFVVTLRGKF